MHSRVSQQVMALSFFGSDQSLEYYMVRWSYYVGFAPLKTGPSHFYWSAVTSHLEASTVWIQYC